MVRPEGEYPGQGRHKSVRPERGSATRALSGSAARPCIAISGDKYSELREQHGHVAATVSKHGGGQESVQIWTARTTNDFSSQISIVAGNQEHPHLTPRFFSPGMRRRRRRWPPCAIVLWLLALGPCVSFRSPAPPPAPKGVPLRGRAIAHARPEEGRKGATQPASFFSMRRIRPNPTLELLESTKAAGEVPERELYSAAIKVSPFWDLFSSHCVVIVIWNGLVMSSCRYQYRS
jgi:hypothetical protein